MGGARVYTRFWFFWAAYEPILLMGDCIIHEVLISFWGFTRFWSPFGDSRGFDLSHIPPKGIYEANVTPAAYLRGFDLVHCTIFGMISPNFCLSVNSVKYYCFSLILWISTSLMGISPVFPAPFPAKINVFRRERPIGFPISCCFFIKVNHIWCLPRPLPASPHLRGFDLVLGIPHVGERYKPRKSAPCVSPVERSKPRV